MKICDEPKCTQPVFSRSKCMFHWKVLYQKPINPISKKQKAKKDAKKELLIEDFIFYDKIWQKRPHICFQCNDPLGDEPSLLFIHHVLPKSQYPQFRHTDWNICLLCADCHSTWETSHKGDKIKELTKKLKEEKIINISNVKI